MNKQIDQMLQQRMDRKNFLKNVALGVVMMTGAASLVKTFHNPSQQPQQGGQPAQGLAYGGSVYGGVKNPSAR